MQEFQKLEQNVPSVYSDNNITKCDNREFPSFLRIPPFSQQTNRQLQYRSSPKSRGKKRKKKKGKEKTETEIFFHVCLIKLI